MPGIRLPGDLRPFDGGGKIADDRLEPDVQALALPAFHRDGNAPIQVARDGARLAVPRSRSYPATPPGRARACSSGGRAGNRRPPAASLDRSRKKCSVSRSSGREPSAFERGLMQLLGLRAHCRSCRIGRNGRPRSRTGSRCLPRSGRARISAPPGSTTAGASRCKDSRSP